jgi:integrase
MIIKNKLISLNDFNSAKKAWDKVKPPFSDSHMKSCVIAAKTMVEYKVQQKELGLENFKQTPRPTKYESKSFLRIIFNRNSYATFFTHFDKGSGIKNIKLGDYPEMSLDAAKSRVTELANGNLDRSSTVYAALKAYKADIDLRVRNKTLKIRSGDTYKSRVNGLEKYFNTDHVFSDIRVSQIIQLLNRIIEHESPNQSNELFDELKRAWAYGSPIYADGNNVVVQVEKNYVSKRVKRSGAAEFFVTIDTIAELYLNIGAATSVHQKNAVRFMILVGVRPINVNSLKWSYLDNIDYPTKISYPASDMKNNKTFIVPVTSTVRNILLEQRKWLEENNCNQVHVFLQPSNPFKAFSVRSLDKLVKDYSPINCVIGNIKENDVKGTNGAFNTMCRKFLKTNVKGQIYKKTKDLKDATIISKLVMHHAIGDKGSDTEEYKEYMKANYDFSEKEFGIEFDYKQKGFEIHEVSILEKVESLSFDNLRQTGKQKTQELRANENEGKKMLRAKLREKFSKIEYKVFNNSYLHNKENKVKDLMNTKEGRQSIIKHITDINIRQ